MSLGKFDDTPQFISRVNEAVEARFERGDDVDGAILTIWEGLRAITSTVLHWERSGLVGLTKESIDISPELKDGKVVEAIITFTRKGQVFCSEEGVTTFALSLPHGYLREVILETEEERLARLANPIQQSDREKRNRQKRLNVIARSVRKMRRKFERTQW